MMKITEGIQERSEKILEDPAPSHNNDRLTEGEATAYDMPDFFATSCETLNRGDEDVFPLRSISINGSIICHDTFSSDHQWKQSLRDWAVMGRTDITYFQAPVAGLIFAPLCATICLYVRCNVRNRFMSLRAFDSVFVCRKHT